MVLLLLLILMIINDCLLLILLFLLVVLMNYIDFNYIKTGYYQSKQFFCYSSLAEQKLHSDFIYSFTVRSLSLSLFYDASSNQSQNYLFHKKG